MHLGHLLPLECGQVQTLDSGLDSAVVAPDHEQLLVLVVDAGESRQRLADLDFLELRVQKRLPLLSPHVELLDGLDALALRVLPAQNQDLIRLRALDRLELGSGSRHGRPSFPLLLSQVELLD